MSYQTENRVYYRWSSLWLLTELQCGSIVTVQLDQCSHVEIRQLLVFVFICSKSENYRKYLLNATPVSSHKYKSFYL